MAKLKPETIEKIYYSIGEISDMIGRDTTTINFWCGVFNIGKKKNARGHKSFTVQEVEQVKTIKELSDSGMFTLKGIEAILKGKIMLTRSDPQSL